MAQLSAQSKRIRADFISCLRQDYVIDETGTYPRAIKASGRTQNLSSLTYNFPPWAEKNNHRIPDDEYPAFRAGLESAIRGGLERVCGISLKPVATRSFVDSKGDLLLNTYRPYTPKRPDNFNEVKTVLDAHFDRLFHQNEQDKKIVSQHLAHTIQNTVERPQWGVVMRGTTGTGKSSLLELVKIALGDNYVWCDNDYNKPFARFAKEFPDNFIVCFDDATASKNTYEDLKLATTRSVANVESKGVDGYVERDVYSRIYVLSNSARPFIMREDDRRFYVTEYLEHPHSASESDDYFVKFTEFWKNQEHAAGIHWWFKDICLDDFVPHSCIKTEARKQLITMSTSGIDSAIAEFLGGKEISFIDADGRTQTEIPPARTIFHENEIVEKLKEKGIDDVPTDLLTRKLTEEHYEIKRRIIGNCNGGKQIDVWQKIVPTQRRAPSLTSEQIEEITAAYDGNF